jgi:hypothetical protein
MKLKTFFAASAFFILSVPCTKASISTNKLFVLETNNVLPPDATNFFVVNSNLLNASVNGGGGGGGGGGVSSVNGLTGAVTGVLTNNETSAVVISNTLSANTLTVNSNLVGPGWSIVTNGAATSTFASYGPNGGEGLYGSAGWTNYALFPSIITLTANGLTGNMTASGNFTAATFSGNGNALTGLSASQLASGTTAWSVLPQNSVQSFNDTLVYSTAGQTGVNNTNVTINGHAGPSTNSVVVATLLVTNNVWFPAPINLPTNASGGLVTNFCQITLNIIENATGGFTFGFDTNYWKFVGGVNVANGITTNAGAMSVITLQNSPYGTNVFGVLSPYFH